MISEYLVLVMTQRDRNDGDRALWDQVEQAERVLTKSESSS